MNVREIFRKRYNRLDFWSDLHSDLDPGILVLLPFAVLFLLLLLKMKRLE